MSPLLHSRVAVVACCYLWRSADVLSLQITQCLAGSRDKIILSFIHCNSEIAELRSIMVTFRAGNCLPVAYSPYVLDDPLHQNLTTDIKLGMK